MAETNNNKPTGPTKSFMTVGPTLHYSHANVHRCWGLSLVVYVGVCFLWIRLISGQALVLNLLELFQTDVWNLARVVAYPLNIYEYPWQIAVLGSVMGILAISPLLTAQLLCFRYSIPMILSVIFIARLPLFGLFLLIGSVAVACRPLRFRSRFIAIALCIGPAMVYWALFGGSQSSDPIRWGTSYAPWIYAWLVALFIAGLVLIIGHYTRYRPGLIWTITLLIGALTLLLFYRTIGFAELDYQLYVAGNNPEEQTTFHDHALTQELDKIISNETTYGYLAGYFYPTDKIELRKKLIEEIENLLYYNRWPHWFQKNMPPHLNYQAKRSRLLAQYNYFIEKWPSSRRMPIALYYKALLHEYHPDARSFGQTEVLRFYNDYPFYENFHIWQALLLQFPESPEALEARWRIAMHIAGKGRFKEAIDLCEVDLTLLQEIMPSFEAQPSTSTGLKTAFHPPAESAMTLNKLQHLRMRLLSLKDLLGPPNQGTTDPEKQRLARFVMLNPHSRNYAQELEALMATMTETGPLLDNVMLARAKLIPDTQLRSKTLQEISDTFGEKDGAIQAFYELGALKVQQWKETDPQEEQKQLLLTEARDLLARFVEAHPDSSFAESARRMLDSLPQVE